MKKIISILTVIALPLTLCACNDDKEKAVTSFDNYKRDIANFQNYFREYTNTNEQQLNKLTLNKYRLSLNLPNDINLLNQTEDKGNLTNNQTDYKQTSNNNDVSSNNVQQNELNTTLDDKNTNPEENNKDVLDEQQPTILPETEQPDTLPAENETNKSNFETTSGTNENLTEEDNSYSKQTENKNISNTNISTLYSLTNDVDYQCNQFCELKNQLTSAIVETQNLIDKVNNNEIELTNEQRMFLTEQSTQLKNLGKRLSNVTTELNFSVNDLSKIMANGGDIDELAMKYLLVLDNLNTGNEMLANSLYSLNMINQLMCLPAPMLGNNQGRILYGFKQNDQPPVIHDYIINNDGNLKENKQETTQQQNEQTENSASTTETPADTSTDVDNEIKPRSWLTPNIDSYGNYRSNIDTFYNTALLNRYLYGRNGFGYGYGNWGGYGMPNAYNYNPNIMSNGYNPTGTFAGNNFNLNNTNDVPTATVREPNNTTNSVQNNLITQDNEVKRTPNKIRKFKINKNIDTYKNADTPTPKQRFAKIKNSISEFFSKIKKPNQNDVQNPIYKMKNDDNTPNLTDLNEAK